MPPRINVAICTYNRADTLQGTLESLISQETDGQFAYEVLVVDDGSTDGTPAVISGIASRSRVPVRYVRGEGIGIAYARSLGVRESRGEWIAWFDDDQLAEPDWLKQLFAVACRTGADIVGGAMVLSLPDQVGVPLNRETRGLLGESRRHKESRISSPRFLPGTGNMLIRRSVLDSFGSFDPSMVRSGEDRDVAQRLLARGCTVWFAPEAVAHHLIPPSRLTVEYFRWTCYRLGTVFACIDNRHRGRATMLLTCAARIAQLLLVHVPLLVWACLLRDQAESLGRRCRIWRAVGYARETLAIVAPRLFAQKGFFAPLEFRMARASFPGHGLCQPGTTPPK